MNPILRRGLTPQRLVPHHLAATRSQAFHSSRIAMVQVGDQIPSVELTENSPGNKVNLAEEFKKHKKGLLIGVPAAFSPACTATHVPGYINSNKIKDAGAVYVVSVNDPFVMKAWGESLDADGKSGIRFLADPKAELTHAFDMAFDSEAIFGQKRSKRYAIVVEDGKVAKVHVEPDNTGVNESAAEKVLG